MQTKSLIVGASGQVGRQLAKVIAQEHGDAAVLRSSRTPREGWLGLDLADLSTVEQAAELFDEQSLSAMYCIGGMTYVDGCEASPEIALRANGKGPGVLAAYAQGRGVPFVFVSTEYVFAGAKEDAGPYTEDSLPHALSVYGKSKLQGEQAVMAAHPGALVIRTTVVYGEDAQEKNYVYSLLRSLHAGQRMRVPQDQISTPTYGPDLANGLLRLVEAQAAGLYHVCGPELMDRLAFAQSVAQFFDLDESLLDGVTTQELQQVAARPLWAGLSSAKLRREFPALRMRTLAQGLEDCAPAMLAFLKRQPATTT